MVLVELGLSGYDTPLESDISVSFAPTCTKLSINAFRGKPPPPGCVR